MLKITEALSDGDLSFFKLQGTYRATSPQNTIKKLLPLLAKLEITRIANITGLDNIGIPVITCFRPNAKHLSSSQGKGVTQDLATISAIMESVEGYHIENPPPPKLYGGFLKLSRNYHTVNPSLFVRGIFSNLNLENIKLAWIEAIDIISSKKLLIPHALINLNSTKLHPEYSYFAVSSNGLAAGNNRDEAICHALYELIERDSLQKWKVISSQSRLATQLDINSINNDELMLLITKLRNADIDLKVWDISTSIGIPAYQCAIYERNSLRKLGVSTGSGAHLSKEVALSRAITEAVQSRVVMISGSRDDIFQDFYIAQSRVNSSISEAFIANGIKDYTDCVSPSFKQSLSDNLEQIKHILISCGYKQILIFDHTKLEIDIPVVQAFVPGLNSDLSRI